MTGEEFTVLERRCVHKGRIFDVFSDRVRLPNGNEATRDYVGHPGSVGILPVHEDGSVTLIRQFRYAGRGFVVEIPAGTLEEGEEPASCAVRELEEETGLKAGKMEEMTSFLLCPGYSTERMHLFRATDLVEGDSRPEENEIITVMRLPLEEAVKVAWEQGDAKTVLALLSERVLRDG